MTTPAKKTSQPAKAAPAKAAPAPFSFANLTATPDAAPQRVVGTAVVPDNILNDLRASWAAKTPLGPVKDERFRGEGRSYTLPTEELATTVANLVRRGAAQLWDNKGKPLGASIRVESVEGGKFKVRFCAKSAVQRTPKKATAK